MLARFISSIGQWTLELIDRAGYLGLLLVSFLDRAAMNWIPAEIVFPIVGVAISRGVFSFWPAMLIITVGSLVGDWLIYFLSRHWGRSLIERFGKYLFIGQHELEHSDRLFQKHGGKLVFFGRFMPIVRAFVAIPAGLTKMPLGRFLLYSALGSLPGNLPLVFVGQKAGENWERLAPFLRYSDFLAVAVVLLLIVWYIYRHRGGLKGRIP